MCVQIFPKSKIASNVISDISQLDDIEKLSSEQRECILEYIENGNSEIHEVATEIAPSMLTPCPLKSPQVRIPVNS